MNVSIFGRSAENATHLPEHGPLDLAAPDIPDARSRRAGCGVALYRRLNTQESDDFPKFVSRAKSCEYSHGSPPIDKRKRARSAARTVSIARRERARALFRWYTK